jgi:hypothetical protein
VIVCGVKGGGCGGKYDAKPHIPDIRAAFSEGDHWACPLGCGRLYDVEALGKILAYLGISLPPPFVAHSDTSEDAADEIKPAANTLRRKVYDYIVDQEAGATDEEIQDALQMNPSTERPRRRELQQGGLIQDSGDRRPTRSGRKAVVWRLVATSPGRLTKCPENP